MKKIQYLALSTLLLISVALGGFAGSCIFSSQPASAQSSDKIASTLYTVTDADGNNKIQLGIDDSGQPLLALFDKNGSRRMVMSLSSDGTPMFIMIDANSVPRMVFGVDNAEGAQIMLYNAEREPIFQALK